MGEEYKSDSVVQVWIDRRVLATLSVWLDSHGIVARSAGDMVRCVLEQVTSHVISEGEIKFIKYTSEAVDVLNSRYRSNLNPSDRGVKNLIDNMVLDEKRKDENLGYHTPAVTPIEKPSKKPKSAWQEMLERKFGVEHARELMRREREEGFDLVTYYRESKNIGDGVVEHEAEIEARDKALMEELNKPAPRS